MELQFKLIQTISGFPPIENLLKTYGIIAFQFDIHPMLLTIQVDMQQKQRIGKAVCSGIFSKSTRQYEAELIIDF